MAAGGRGERVGNRWGPAATAVRPGRAGRRPVRVEVVGLFPLYFKMCPRAVPWGTGCDLGWPEEQEQDYPPAERARQRQLEALVHHLAGRFGPQIDVVTVPLTSWRGTWLATGFRLRTDDVAVVAGGRCVRLDEGYDAIDDLVAALLAAGDGRGDAPR
ncbi:MAG TPA: hypothetical protein VIL38_05020 [Thermaerobacter sp.]